MPRSGDLERDFGQGNGSEPATQCGLKPQGKTKKEGLGAAGETSGLEADGGAAREGLEASVTDKRHRRKLKKMDSQPGEQKDSQTAGVYHLWQVSVQLGN